MSFQRSFFSMLVGNGLAALLGALTTLVAIRGMETAEWAWAAIAAGLGPALGVGLSLGSVTFMIRELSSVDDETTRRVRYSMFFYRRATVALVLLGLGALCFMFSALLGWIVVLAGVRFWRSGSSTLMSSERRFRPISALVVLEKAIALAILLVVMRSGAMEWWWLPVALVTSFGVYGVAATFYERPVSRWSVIRTAMGTPFALWAGSGRFGVASLTGPVQQADVSVMAMVSDGVQAGQLAAGSRLVGGLNVFGAALATVVLPYFAGGASMRAVFKSSRSVIWVGGGVILSFAVAAFTTPLWVPVLLGGAYSAATTVVSCYVLMALILTLLQPVVAVLQAWHLERVVMWLALAQAFAGIGSIALFGRIAGATGAAVAQLFVVFCFLIVHFLVAIHAGRIRAAHGEAG